MKSSCLFFSYLLRNQFAVDKRSQTKIEKSILCTVSYLVISKWEDMVLQLAFETNLYVCMFEDNTHIQLFSKAKTLLNRCLCIPKTRSQILSKRILSTNGHVQVKIANLSMWGRPLGHSQNV